MMASASKDETVIVWNMDRLKQNFGKMIGDPSDYIITIIDDHVIYFGGVRTHI